MAFSAVLITLNAARYLEPCLPALAMVTDDIVVVDHHSTDATRDIAARLGCRIFEKDWEGYGPGKNFGNRQARYDWILSIDADEVLSEALVRSLKELDTGSLPENTVFSVNRLSRYCGRWIRHGGWYPDWHVRLFHRAFASWGDEEVHEELRFAGTPVVRKLKGHLLHYTVDSVEELWEKAGKYAALSAGKYWRQGKKAGWVKRRLNPVFRFVMDYVVWGGFLDGKAGWQIARVRAHETRLKYELLRKLIKNRGTY